MTPKLESAFFVNAQTTFSQGLFIDMKLHACITMHNINPFMIIYMRFYNETAFKLVSLLLTSQLKTDVLLFQGGDRETHKHIENIISRVFVSL